MIPFAFWEGLGVGLLVSAVGTLAVWAYLRRRYGGATRLTTGAVRPTAPAARPATRRTVGAAPLPQLATATASAAAVRAPSVAAVVSVRTDPAEPAPLNGGVVRISHRVLLHIARLGRIPVDEVQPRALSQAGMVDALGVQQGALTGVLRRLVAAGVLEEHRGHVYGIDRRVKFYRLSPVGVDLCRELQGRVPPAPVVVRPAPRTVAPGPAAPPR